MIDEATQPGGRPAAPGVLRLVQDFVNTNDLEGGADLLGTPDSLRRWLVQERLISGKDPVAAHDVERVRRAREAVRTLAMANNGEGQDPGALRTLNELLSDGFGRLRFDASGSVSLQSITPGVEGALFSIVARVFQSMIDGTWLRMKSCRRDVCRWLYYDHSRNRSSTWCAMAVCGNRIKTASFYRRRKQVPVS